MPSTLKTYQKKTRTLSSNVTKSVEAINALFAQNLSKRMIGRKRRKPKLHLPELPPRTDNYLTDDDSVKISAEDTFDKLRGGKAYNKFDVTDNVIKYNSSSEASKSGLNPISVSVSFHPPVMTRQRRKKSAPKTETKEKSLSIKVPVRTRNRTLDQTVDNSLCIEKPTKTKTDNLSYLRLPERRKPPTCSRAEASFGPVHCSTPKIVENTLSPITCPNPEISEKFVEKSYEIIQEWDCRFPIDEGSSRLDVSPAKKNRRRKSIAIVELKPKTKMNESPKVYIKSSDIIIDHEEKRTGGPHFLRADFIVNLKGFNSEEQVNSQEKSTDVRHILEELESKLNINAAILNVVPQVKSSERQKKVPKKYIGVSPGRTGRTGKRNSVVTVPFLKNRSSKKFIRRNLRSGSSSSANTTRSVDLSKRKSYKRGFVKRKQTSAKRKKRSSKSSQNNSKFVTKRRGKISVNKKSIHLTDDILLEKEISYYNQNVVESSSFDVIENTELDEPSYVESMTVDLKAFDTFVDNFNKSSDLEETNSLKLSTKNESSNNQTQEHCTSLNSTKNESLNNQTQEDCTSLNLSPEEQSHLISFILDHNYTKPPDSLDLTSSNFNDDSGDLGKRKNVNTKGSVIVLDSIDLTESDISPKPRKSKIIIISDITITPRKPIITKNHIPSARKNILHDHSYTSVKASPEPVKSPANNNTGCVNESEIIESSELRDDCGALEPKSFALKPGKSYRRSLTHLRRTMTVLETAGKSACARDCVCLKCIFRRKVESRQSSQIVPAGNDSQNNSVLEIYARSRTSYVPSQHQQFIETSLDDSVRDLSLNSRKSLIQDSVSVAPVVTARDIVLRRCGQVEPLPFEECFPDSLLQHCRKIGEGVYGEVFLHRNQNGGTTVMKIIPIEGDQLVNGEKQKMFDEILSEIIIAMELSNLRNNKKNVSNTFNEVQKVRCIQGCYPEKLVDWWDLYDETKGSENDSPQMFNSDQQYIVLELANGGTDLEAYCFNNAQQVFYMFKQVAVALAVAERELQFEHRDLHWGNILLNTVERHKTVNFVLNGKEIEVPTYGVEAAIIDFTLSRIEFDGVVIFNDLSADDGLFTATGDYQFEIYRLMQSCNGNNWQHFDPYSNILWLHYILDKVPCLRYKNAKSKTHKQYLVKLKQIKDTILSCKSVEEFVDRL